MELAGNPHLHPLEAAVPIYIQSNTSNEVRVPVLFYSWYPYCFVNIMTQKMNYNYDKSMMNLEKKRKTITYCTSKKREGDQERKSDKRITESKARQRNALHCGQTQPIKLRK
jgi:hypothetical protein